MEEALCLARKGEGRTSPNPMVGAVLVKAGKIIATGFHQRCGGDHAEVIALKQAGKNARGATLYVTLEPCGHYGRTPPCVDRIIKSGIREVVVAMKDPNPLNNGKSIRKLRRAGVKTRVGICQGEARKLNEVFVKYITTGMPFVTVKWAQTLDGKISTASGHSKWITSSKSRRFARYLRGRHDAILVGIETVLADNPRLDPLDRKGHFRKIVLDSSLRIPFSARLLKKSKSNAVIVATTKNASSKKRLQLEKLGVEVIRCPEKNGMISLRWFFQKLAKKEITSIFIEGGAKTIGSAIKDDLVDKVCIFMAPKLMGDQQAKSAVDGLSPRYAKDAISFKDLAFWHCGEDIFIEGTFAKKE